MQMHDVWMEGAAGVTARGAALTFRNVKESPSKTKTSTIKHDYFPEDFKVRGWKSTMSISDLLFIFRRQEMRRKL